MNMNETQSKTDYCGRHWKLEGEGEKKILFVHIKKIE